MQKKAKEPASPEDDERAHRIREEIKRKILQGRIANAKPITDSSPQTEQRYEIGVPYQEQKYPAKEYQEQRPSRSGPQTPPPVSPQPVDVQNRQEQTQIDALSAAVKQAEIAREKVRAAKAKTKRKKPDSQTTVSPAIAVQVDIKAVLRDRNGARRAFLYTEIMGPPVGLRRQGKMGPLWDM